MSVAIPLPRTSLKVPKKMTSSSDEDIRLVWLGWLDRTSNTTHSNVCRRRRWLLSLIATLERIGEQVSLGIAAKPKEKASMCVALDTDDTSPSIRTV